MEALMQLSMGPRILSFAQLVYIMQNMEIVLGPHTQARAPFVFSS